MALIRTLDGPDDEHMIIDHHHWAGRTYQNRSVWIYWDDHIAPNVPARLLITDDFGDLVPQSK